MGYVVDPAAWEKIPDLSTHCVKAKIDFLENWVRQDYGDKLIFNGVSEGWFWELDANNMKYRLVFSVTVPPSQAVHNGEAILLETKVDGEIVVTPISIHIANIEKGGYVVIEIPDPSTHCVVEVGKWAVDEHTRITGQYLEFVQITCGWYYELPNGSLRYRLHILTKDCVGRLRTYKAVVLEENPGRVRTLESFELIKNN